MENNNDLLKKDRKNELRQRISSRRFTLKKYIGETTLSDKRMRRGLFPILLSVMGIIVGIGIMYFSVIDIREAQRRREIWDQSNNWPSVMGEVLSSDVRYIHVVHGPESPGEQDRFYYPHLTYQFSIEGELITSDNFDFGASYTRVKLEALEVSKKYLPGTRVAVYYDPDNPQEAVLVPGCSDCKIDPYIYGNLVAGILITVCVFGLLIFSIVNIRKRYAL